MPARLAAFRQRQQPATQYHGLVTTRIAAAGRRRPSSGPQRSKLYKTRIHFMCGRFTHMFTWRQLWKLYQSGTAIPATDLKASYNVAPSQEVPALRHVDDETEGVMLRWGLVPFFARGVPPKYSTINARVETIETAPSYRGPWKRGQRCMLLASGFYEWHIKEDGTKQPYYITVADQELFGFAGLWDRSEAADGAAIESATIITMPANLLMAEIHNGRARMPAILAVEQREA
jgi:putative SOS response-associated peptidase YedK